MSAGYVLLKARQKKQAEADERNKRPVQPSRFLNHPVSGRSEETKPPRPMTNESNWVATSHKEQTTGSSNNGIDPQKLLSQKLSEISSPQTATTKTEKSIQGPAALINTH
uniref:Uncharacterized protein n=1 Tax=Plectus sambesii TaxID=2011161 RepID=A0A914W491_9BILA